jgi:anti-anti-sigma regulatory factor
LVPLFDNFDQVDVESLEARVLDALCENRQLRGVIFNCSEVVTTDGHDLQRLEAMFQAIRLVGGKVGLCGINPGLAMLIIRSGLNFEREAVAANLDDLMIVLGIN